MIDAGISLRRIEGSLEQFGLKLSDVQFVLITHEHSDHISGLMQMLKKARPLLFVPRQIFKFMESEYPIAEMKAVQYHSPFKFESLEITGFNLLHDSTVCYGYRIDSPEFSLGYATDLGQPSINATHYLNQVNYLVLESNYDHRMLLTGKYPEFLKRRILSPYGHLDNEIAVGFLKKVIHPELKKVMLAHLSKENNDPEIVRSKFSKNFSGLEIIVAARNTVTRMF